MCERKSAAQGGEEDEAKGGIGKVVFSRVLTVYQYQV